MEYFQFKNGIGQDKGNTGYSFPQAPLYHPDLGYYFPYAQGLNGFNLGRDGDLYIGVPFTFNASIHTNFIIDNLPLNHNIVVGASVTGASIPGATTVSAVSLTSITMNNASGATTTEPITFQNPSITTWSQITSLLPGSVIRDDNIINIAFGSVLQGDTTDPFYFIGARTQFILNGSIIAGNNPNSGTFTA